MEVFSRFQEYKVLFYRLFLAYVFYFIARVLFTIYNYELLGEPTFFEFLKLSYHGLLFDTSAILYVNLVFILLNLLPLYINTKAFSQKVFFYIYFAFNLLAYATNFIDFIYFKYILSRSTLSSFESIENESNKMGLLISFLGSYWHVLLLFVLILWLWIFLYKKVNVKYWKPHRLLPYFGFSFLFLIVFSAFIIMGLRGGFFNKASRPITLVDANRYVKNNLQATIVLNTPFAIIRTINKKAIFKVDYLSKSDVVKYGNAIKQYDSEGMTKPNIVIIIIESYGREYLGAFNPNTNIKNYQSYSPFIDSLAQHSLIFTNAYANGYKSIHGMSSVLSGIPSFKNAFTSSPYSNQKIESLVSVLNEEGYNTSFFHGADNGSMGFLGFSNILGIDSYIGKKEYNNEEDFDGFWGIWDEPFLQFMKKNLDTIKEPFMSTVFTVSSHSPYVIPEKYKEKFPEGELIMHKCIRYTDYALKRFFEEAKKSSWYKNTIFVMVADHGNLIQYPEYRKQLNLNTVPILFYSSNEKYIGSHNELAQQIDIYPTLLDMIGYNKPFRSWGRSLISDKEEPFVLKYMNGVYYYLYKNYVCEFDGEKVTGFYKDTDKDFANNLIGENPELMLEMEIKCKAFIQDYMNRIVDGELSSK